MDDITKNNDIFLRATRNYIDSDMDRDSVRERNNPQGQLSGIRALQRQQGLSSVNITFSWPKLKSEEVETHEKAKLRLAKQKQENATRKKELEKKWS